MKHNLITGLCVFGFALAAQAQAPLFYEPFDYPDGALTNVAAGTWLWHSGSGNTYTLNAVNQQAFLRQPDLTGGGDDYNRLLGASFDPATDNTTKLYAGFFVNFSALPYNTGTSDSGSYFAHFKSSAANEFYARVGANTSGAAPGTLRLAIQNENFNNAGTIEYPMDLNLGQTYFVVMSLDLATDQSSLWVNPVDESSAFVTATDAFSFSGQINAFALRQGVSGNSPNQGAYGILTLDDLRVGTSWASIVPEPTSAGILVIGGLVGLLARRKR